MDSIEDKTRYSSYIENMVEHVFISEVLQEAWIRLGCRIDVLRAEVDDSGYDIVLSLGKVARYIQLKTSEEGAARSKQNLNIALAEKPNACIIWIERKPDDKSGRFVFEYLFFGTEAECTFPDISKYKTAKHTRANADGFKKEREAIREIPKSAFIRISSMRSLLERLFGDELTSPSMARSDTEYQEESST